MLTSLPADWYRGFLFWLGEHGFFNWLGPHVFAPVDSWLYPRTHGAVVSAGPPVLPLLMLTSRGRRSGLPRSVPLLYAKRGDDYFVVASNWGRAKHPAWSDNLLAAAGGVIEIGRRRLEVSAHLLSAEEKAQIWPELCAFCPVWQAYADRSGRDLRVFSLRACSSAEA